MPTGDQHELRFDAVTFRYPAADHAVVRDLSFHVTGGEVLWLVGDNGTGKTTLGKLLVGIYAPTDGSMLIDNIVPGTLPPRLRLRYAFLVYQRAFLGFVEAVVDREIKRSVRLTGTQEHDQLVTTICRETHINDLLQKNPLDLSFTQGWRVALAIGALINPVVLFIDELPNLKGRLTVEALERVLHRRQERGGITILTAHEQPPKDLPCTRSITLTNEQS